MTTKNTRKSLSAAELKEKLEKMKQSLVALEQRAYAGELDEVINKSNIVASFKSVKEKVKGANDLAILTAIGKAVGIKRLVVTQTEAKKRTSKAK